MTTNLAWWVGYSANPRGRGFDSRPKITFVCMNMFVCIGYGCLLNIMKCTYKKNMLVCLFLSHSHSTNFAPSCVLLFKDIGIFILVYIDILFKLSMCYSGKKTWYYVGSYREINVYSPFPKGKGHQIISPIVSTLRNKRLIIISKNEEITDMEVDKSITHLKY
jgi:hypothetical protein